MSADRISAAAVENSETSMDRISATARETKKRKADGENVGMNFTPGLKPIITVASPSKPILLLCTENSNFEFLDSNYNVEGNEECHTPKGEEYQLPKILSCPPAPRKPRPTSKKSKSQDYFIVSRRELSSLFNLSNPKKVSGESLDRILDILEKI
ncbi:hypothetical protein SUGI_0899830 [Cryptomeria japonica]|uniref:cyclin-dependent protein kinase inhibitor SMR6 n=1 Tax=Cryptomeria japonica TaxID=3369 RepID=UPI002414AE33|nr:cyclin-dependent protein kinase inhibitor SMR6 [Cryptomeria japonica]GLJ43324.1 hypothetical protein SUGI_0899830 [Cryptomeria japonica]